MVETRREFLTAAALAAGGLMTGCVGSGARTTPKRPTFWRGALQHLGGNMWGDCFDGAGHWPSSFEEREKRPNPASPIGSPSPYCNFVVCRDDLWKKAVDRMAELKYNMIFIDLGEGIFYPSHPELAVNGTWSVEKIRTELDRIRARGITPFPKLNFSTCHDGWLKEYHRMVSTPKYYEVVADVIRDVCEIFDSPELFHIGFDEEVAGAGKRDFCCVLRQGDLWWHDFFYTVGQVEKNGSRAVMWSDQVCAGRETFLKKMTKNVLLSPWYYGKDFSAENLTWKSEFEKQTNELKGVQRNLAAALPLLDRAGFDLLPCTSNWSCAEASEAMVAYCRTNLDPAHLKGLYTAPWMRNVPTYVTPKKKKRRGFGPNIEGLELFAAAMDRHGLKTK